MSTTTTMTTREFYQEIINVLQVQQMEGRNNAELYSNTADCNVLMDKALAQIAALDARNERRKSTDSKEKKEAAARREQVLHFLTENEGAFTREQIAEAVGFEPSKVTGACTALVKEGLVSKSKVKVDKTEKMAYSAI